MPRQLEAQGFLTTALKNFPVGQRISVSQDTVLHNAITFIGKRQMENDITVRRGQKIEIESYTRDGKAILLIHGNEALKDVRIWVDATTELMPGTTVEYEVTPGADVAANLQKAREELNRLFSVGIEPGKEDENAAY